MYEPEVYCDALNVIVDAKTVVVYCGAGVTLSRTGLTWDQLVLSMAQRLQNDLTIYRLLEPPMYEELIARLKAGNTAPLKNATLVSEFISALTDLRHVRSSYGGKLRDILTECLYASDDIQNAVLGDSAELLKFTSNTVGALLHAGKRVVVVTTNYDTYIEKELRLLSDVKGLGGEHGLSVRVYGGARPPAPEQIFRPHEVPLVYLHGRLPQSDDIDKNPDGSSINDGEIVFSEQQYAESERRTKSWLKAVTDNADALLILGSSMDDRPLLNLIHPKQRAGEGYRKAGGRRSKGDKNSRQLKHVILVKPLDPEDSSAEQRTDRMRRRLVAFDRLRYNHLGVSHFIPVRTFSDIPLFLRDLRLHLLDKQGPTPPGDSPDCGKEYVSRSRLALKNWCVSISKCLDENAKIGEKGESVAELLLGALNKDKDHLVSLFSDFLGVPDKGRLVVRLELWLRGLTPLQGDIDRVVRVADSDTILVNTESRRSEYLYRRFPSRTAAVRVIQYGRARLESLAKYGETSSASRWQAFYSLPLVIEVGSGKARLPIIVGSMVVSLGLSEDGVRLVDKETRDNFQRKVDELAYLESFQQPYQFARIQVFLNRVGKEALLILERLIRV